MPSARHDLVLLQAKPCTGLARDLTKPSSNSELLEAVPGLCPQTEPPDSLCCALGGNFSLFLSAHPSLLSQGKGSCLAGQQWSWQWYLAGTANALRQEAGLGETQHGGDKESCSSSEAGRMF